MYTTLWTIYFMIFASLDQCPRRDTIVIDYVYCSLFFMTIIFYYSMFKVFIVRSSTSSQGKCMKTIITFISLSTIFEQSMLFSFVARAKQTIQHFYSFHKVFWQNKYFTCVFIKITYFFTRPKNNICS